LLNKYYHNNQIKENSKIYNNFQYWIKMFHYSANIFNWENNILSMNVFDAWLYNIIKNRILLIK